MNRDEARFLLTAVRADRIDRNDSRVAEALRLVEEDPELRDWFETSGRFDRVVAERLAEVAPPPGLRDSILAGMDLSRRSRWTRWSKKSVVLLAAAAVLTFGLFLASPYLPGPDPAISADAAGSFVEFEVEVLEAIANLKSLDHRSPDPAEILSWLGDRGIDGPPALAGGSSPERNKAGAFVGCKIIEWRGHRASLICLRRSGEGHGMPDLHLVTVPAEAVAGLGRDEVIVHLPDAEGSPRRWSTAMWRSGDLVHLVAVDGRHPDPRRLVPLG